MTASNSASGNTPVIFSSNTGEVSDLLSQVDLFVTKANRAMIFLMRKSAKSGTTAGDAFSKHLKKHLIVTWLTYISGLKIDGIIYLANENLLPDGSLNYMVISPKV